LIDVQSATAQRRVGLDDSGDSIGAPEFTPSAPEAPTLLQRQVRWLDQ
jgi:hypothetical protein